MSALMDSRRKEDNAKQAPMEGAISADALLREAALFEGLELSLAMQPRAAEYAADLIGDIDALQGLTSAQRESIYWHLMERFGPEFAERILDSDQARGVDEKAILGSLQRETERRLANARARKNIIDLDRVRAGRTQVLLEQLAAAFGLSLDGVVVKVDEEAKHQTRSRGARGLQLERTVLLDPDRYDPERVSGRELLAHEVVHLAQRGPTPSRTSSTLHPSKPAAEQEAASLGRRFALGSGGLSRPEAMLPAGDIAADTDAQTAVAEAIPKQVELHLAGRTVTVDLPASASKTVKVALDQSPVTGLTLTTAILRFDESWDLQSGTVAATVTLGPYVSMAGLALSISVDGTDRAQISTAIRGATLSVGDAIRGTLDLDIDDAGISGSGTLEHTQFKLQEGVTLSGGSVAVSVDPEGRITASGRLNGQLANVGQVVLEAEITDSSVGGSIRVELDQPISLLDGITVDSGLLSGSYTEQGLVIGGGVQVTLGKWTSSAIEARYNVSSGSWSVAGELLQAEPISLGEFTLNTSTLGLVVTDGVLDEVRASATVASADWEVGLEGTYDMSSGALSGEGDVSILNDKGVMLGESGIAITSAMATGTVVQNRLTMIQGQLEASMTQAGMPTFQFIGETLKLDIIGAGVLSGSATITTTRDLSFGDTSGVRIQIPQGASGTARVEENVLAEVTGGIPFTVADMAGQFGSGSIDFTFDGPEQRILGDATLTLDADYGFPHRQDGPVKLKQGGALRVSVQGEPKLAELAEVAFYALNPGEPGLGRLAGWLTGALVFETMNLDVSGMASLDQDWPLSTQWGEVALTQGGEVALEIKASELNFFEGTLPWGCTLNTAHGPLVMSGELNGRYTQADRALSGQAEATLTAPYALPLRGGVDSLILAAGSSASTQLKANELEGLTMTLSASYYREGEHLLDGQLIDASYLVNTGELKGSGTFSLMRDLQHTLQDSAWTFLIAQGATMNASVADSTIERLGGTVPWRLYDGDGAGEALLDGELIEAMVNLDEAMSFSGGLSMKTARDFELPATQNGNDTEGVPSSLRMKVTAGSGVSGRVEASALQTASADLNMAMELADQALASGALRGEWDLAQDQFTGTGTVKLSRQLVVGQPPTGEGLAAWRLALSEGSGIEVKLAQNRLEQAHISCAAGLLHQDKMVAIGVVDGAYKLGNDAEGFTGHVEAQLTERLAWSGDETFQYWLEPETLLKATLNRTQITAAEGTFSLTAEDSGVGKVNVLAMGSYSVADGVAGEGQIKVLDDIALSQPGQSYGLFIAKDSGGQGSVNRGALTTLSGQALLRVDRLGTPLGQGSFEIGYNLSDGAAAELSASGSLELLSEVDITPPTAEPLTFKLTGGTGVSCQLESSQLAWLEGSLNLAIGDLTQGGQFAQAQLTGRYTAGETPDLSGTGAFEVVRYYDLGVELDGYALMLDRGAGASVQIAASTLESLSAAIPILVMNPQGMMEWRVALQGTYVAADKRFDGAGSAELLIPLTLAEGFGPEGDYALDLSPASGLEVSVSSNALSQITGTLSVMVSDGRGDFLSATASGEISRAGEVDELVRLSGKAEVVRDKHMLSVGEWSGSLEPGSDATVLMENNALTSLGGTLITRLDNSAGPFARIALGGNYVHPGGFSGVGMAELIQTIDVATVGDYHLKVLPGSGAEVTLLETELTHITGALLAQIDDLTQGGQRFISLQSSANYDVIAGRFEGEGTAEVHCDRALGSLGDETLFLCAGTGAHVRVADNTLQEVGGRVLLRLEDPQGPYLQVQLDGSFDAAGGTGFSGQGATEVTRDKRLTELGSYSFWLTTGAGANAVIEQNVLTRVEGRVPFKVLDGAPEPLLEGQAEGVFTTEGQAFTGSGAIFLGRDMAFDLGGSTVATFKKGSGGEAHVEANELRQLGGILAVELAVDGEPLVDINAAGLYDAVSGRLIWVEGQATLRRPFELLGGEVVIDGVTGSARIEDNKLIRAGGSGRIQIPALNDVEGAFDLSWSNETGQDVYSGQGTLNFTLFDDPATGRSMSGEVSVAYHEDHTLAVAGEVDYHLTPQLGGAIGVEVNETLDPVLNGIISVEGVEMIAGRNLFSLDIPLLPKMSIPVIPGVNIDFGANAGMALDVLPLMLAQASIGISNFRPLAEDVTVPDFETQLALSWGVQLEAGVAAYAGLSAGVPGANVGLGIEGEVELSAPMTLHPIGILRARGGEFSGELSIGLQLAPTLALIGRPYLQATLGKEFRHDMAEWEVPLGELFSLDWATAYTWGDAGPAQTPGPVTDTPAVPPPTRRAGPTSAESAKFETSTGPVSDKAGGPQLGGGPELGQRDGSSKAGEMAETLAQAQRIAKGVSSLAKLIGELASFVGAALTAGPVGMVIMLAWKLFQHGAGYFEMLKSMVHDVVIAIDEILDIIAPYMPEWWSRIVSFFKEDPPSILTALMGADDAMRDAVNAGEHRHLPADARGQMINTMMSGACLDADEQCICEVLEWSARQGDISAVLQSVDGGADAITSALHGAEDTRVKALFDRCGVRY